jgi:Zn-finger nucleic acid-binding protein
MERICSHCHAQLSLEVEADWCPACGGALLERGSLPAEARKGSPPAEVVLDHRGIVLPRRHALGGIITPQ